MVKGAPYIGVMTWFGPPYIEGEEIDRSPRFQALIRLETSGRAVLQGDECPIEVEGKRLRGIERIDEEFYRHLIEHADWATKYAPHLPDANPETPIDWMETPI